MNKKYIEKLKVLKEKLFLSEILYIYRTDNLRKNFYIAVTPEKEFVFRKDNGDKIYKLIEYKFDKLLKNKPKGE